MIKINTFFSAAKVILFSVTLLPALFCIVGCAKKKESQEKEACEIGLISARYMHTDILLNDGKVLIVSGKDESGKKLTVAEIYDPATGAFTKTVGKQNIARIMASAVTVLEDGRIFIGGFGTPEIFNPDNGSFTLTDNLLENRC